MGWLILLLLIALSLGGLWLLGVRGGLLTAAAAALAARRGGLCAAGPARLAGLARRSGTKRRDIVPLTEARHAFFGNFTPRGMLAAACPKRWRAHGDSENAVGILQNAVGRYPDEPAVVDRARQRPGRSRPRPDAAGRTGLPARGRARAGLSRRAVLLRAGAGPLRRPRRRGRACGSSILAKAPPNASWRPLVEQGIQALSRPPPTLTLR